MIEQILIEAVPYLKVVLAVCMAVLAADFALKIWRRIGRELDQIGVRWRAGPVDHIPGPRT